MLSVTEVWSYWHWILEKEKFGVDFKGLHIYEYQFKVKKTGTVAYEFKSGEFVVTYGIQGLG